VLILGSIRDRIWLIVAASFAPDDPPPLKWSTLSYGFLLARRTVTFSVDLFTYESARGALREIVDKVWAYCERSGTRGRTVTLKTGENLGRRL
jgi:hypothetical protein